MIFDNFKYEQPERPDPPKLVFATQEHLKKWSEKYWSKQETGESWWDGGFKKALYHADIGVRNMSDEMFLSNVNDTDRRISHISSDYEREWKEYDLTKCFRVDVDFDDTYENYVNRPNTGKRITIDDLKSDPKEEDDETWNSLSFDKTWMNTTPSYSLRMMDYPVAFVGNHFGWMYRCILQRFFMEHSVEFYDVQKGLKVDWPVPPDDEVWKHWNDDTLPKTIPYPPVERPENVPAHPPIAPFKPKPLGAKTEDAENPLYQPPETAPPQPFIEDFGPKFLLPLLTITEDAAKKARQNLKACVEKRRSLLLEKQKIMKEYNDTIMRQINLNIERLNIEINLYEFNIRDEMYTLQLLQDVIDNRNKLAAQKNLSVPGGSNQVDVNEATNLMLARNEQDIRIKQDLKQALNTLMKDLKGHCDKLIER